MVRDKQGRGSRPGNRFISSGGRASRGQAARGRPGHESRQSGEGREWPARFTVTRMGHDGRGIASWQGKTLFIEGALAGEEVTARLLQEHTRYAEALVTDIITASAERQAPVCRHYEGCGGCQLQHWQAEQQLDFKQQTALEQMKRWSGLEAVEVVEPIRSATEAYRGRARLGVWYEPDGRVILGFRQRQSKRLTPIDDCRVLDTALNRLLQPLQQWLETEHSARAITHVELLTSNQQQMVILRHTRTPGERDWQGLRLIAEHYACSILTEDNEGVLQDLQGQRVDPRLFYSPDPQLPPLAWHPGDFIQVNQAVNQRMVAQAIEWLALQGNERVLDLFCGIGNFTLPLARHCAEVTGIEAVESMVVRGRENARRNGVENVRFIAADLSRVTMGFLKQQCGAVDAILLDPPRDGAREVLLNIRQLAAPRLVYVSCNPATLARDAAVLAEAGYRLEKQGVMDMFPHTAHVESMALFILNKK